MIWALFGLLLVVVGVFAFTVFLMLTSVSQTLANALETLERVHRNDGRRIDTILDRLMAMDFETFKNYQLAEEAEVGGQEFAEEEPTVRLEVPGITPAYGHTDLEAAAAERRLLMEDFPEESEVEA